MRKRIITLIPVIGTMLLLIHINMVGAQPSGPESNKALPPLGSLTEYCYGTAAPGSIEFVCKDENYHYRAIDCDEVNEDTGECHSAECTVAIGEDCARIRASYEDWSNNEPLCYLCTTLFAPVYG